MWLAFDKGKRQVLILLISSILGILIGILNSVLNTRNLSPELYGDYRYVQNIISFVSSLLLVGFFVSGSRLLAISKTEEYSRRIRGAMCIILVITIFVLMIIMTVLYVSSLYSGKDNLSTIYLVSIPLSCNILLLNYVDTTAQGDNHIGRIAIARIVPNLLYFIAAYLIYYFFSASPSLMLALYNGSAIVVLGIVILSTRPSFSDLKESMNLLYNENKHYGFNVYLGSVVGVSSQYLAGIALGQFCDTNIDVGYYTLALTIAGPLALVPSIIGTTYFKRFASENAISSRVFFASVSIMLISFMAFSLFIKYVVGFLYDSSYSSVSVYAVYLAIATSVHGLGDMLNRFLGSHGRGRELRNGAIACGLTIVFGSFVLVRFFGIQGAIITKIASSTIYCGFMYYYYRVFVKENDGVDE